jgi:uncharacterized protein YjbI with pentapeptide repeats
LNFSGSDLSSTRLGDASLLNADLSTCEHLIAAQFAGANLKGARLPEYLKSSPQLEEAISQVKSVRKMFGVLFGAVVMLLITIMCAPDVALFKKLEIGSLPIVPSTVPFPLLFLLGPVLILVLYLDFIIKHQSACEILAKLPAVQPNGIRLDQISALAPLGIHVSTSMPRLTASISLMARLANVAYGFVTWTSIPALMVFILARYSHRHEIVGLAFLAILAAAALLFARWGKRCAAACLNWKHETDACHWQSTELRSGFASSLSFGIVLFLAGCIGIGTLDGFVEQVLPPASTILHSVQRVAVADLGGSLSDKLGGWTSEHPNEHLNAFDVKDANLRGADLRGAFAPGARFSNTDLAGTDFRGADLRGSKFSDVNLVQANFSQADLVGAQFDLNGSKRTGILPDDEFQPDLLIENANANKVAIHANNMNIEILGAEGRQSRVMPPTTWHKVLQGSRENMRKVSELAFIDCTGLTLSISSCYLVDSKFKDVFFQTLSIRDVCMKAPSFVRLRNRASGPWEEFQNQNLCQVLLDHVIIQGGSFNASVLTFGRFKETSIEGTEFRNSCFDGVHFIGEEGRTKIDRVNVYQDNPDLGPVFTRCDFVGLSLGEVTVQSGVAKKGAGIGPLLNKHAFWRCQFRDCVISRRAVEAMGPQCLYSRTCSFDPPGCEKSNPNLTLMP